MAFREDWTRITHSVRTIISAFEPSPRTASGNNRNTMVRAPRVPRTPILVRRTMNARFLAEIERARNQAYTSSLRNQIR